MLKEQIYNLLAKGEFPETSADRELIETHISWVILSDPFAYKIKKPIRYSFLDFSTLALRKHFCEREIELNRRLTDKIYLDVLPIRQWQDRLIMGGKEGTIIDYAVRMRKMDSGRQMDKLLSQNKVAAEDIRKLAEKIAFFHMNTNIIYEKNILDIRDMFNDLGAEEEFLAEELGRESSIIIRRAMGVSAGFLEKNKKLLAARLKAGFFRDCHGDLHSRNIFLLPSPEPFDCIEFNDDLRQIDVLNEVAFLCMDLDAFGRQDLSDLFVNDYNHFFPSMITDADNWLFVYYKSYRANIRAKVNSLRARSAADPVDKARSLKVADKYLRLMDNYLQTPGLS